MATQRRRPFILALDDDVLGWAHGAWLLHVVVWGGHTDGGIPQPQTPLQPFLSGDWQQQGFRISLPRSLSLSLAAVVRERGPARPREHAVCQALSGRVSRVCLPSCAIHRVSMTTASPQLCCAPRGTPAPSLSLTLSLSLFDSGPLDAIHSPPPPHPLPCSQGDDACEHVFDWPSAKRPQPPPCKAQPCHGLRACQPRHSWQPSNCVQWVPACGKVCDVSLLDSVVDSIGHASWLGFNNFEAI
ncbi:uncharacterized protein J3D65DRAFT_128697 [Phyllosticta citribraziliensis]|uniref:Uncharacterized protein n=1 Tax=Phyllosticta citribraziliensis TaxID=989973 RepID=A0ABR1L5R8_9PEZI